MNNFSRFHPLTFCAALSVAAASLAGCFSTAPSNSVETTTTTQKTMPVPTPTPAPTPTPTKPPFVEDERYKATKAENPGFGPDAKPDAMEIYQNAMAKARQPRPPLNLKVPDKVRVVMKTNRGPITLELDAKAAPLHVKSFVYLSQRGFYNGTVFHRHADLLNNGKGFIIQGGDPLSKDEKSITYAGLGNPGYTIPREKNKLTHQKLVIAAARSTSPDSAGCQFYITQGAVPFLDEGDGYTVYGKVVDGAAAALQLTENDTLLSVKVVTPIAPFKP